MYTAEPVLSGFLPVAHIVAYPAGCRNVIVDAGTMLWGTAGDRWEKRQKNAAEHECFADGSLLTGDQADGALKTSDTSWTEIYAASSMPWTMVFILFTWKRLTMKYTMAFSSRE